MLIIMVFQLYQRCFGKVIVVCLTERKGHQKKNKQRNLYTFIVVQSVFSIAFLFRLLLCSASAGVHYFLSLLLELIFVAHIVCSIQS